MRKKLVIGSRGSKLALWQTNWVREKIERQFGLEVEIKKIKTTGDKILDSPLAKIGSKGLFVKEIELALEREEIDLAVHSAKDVPTDLPPGLVIAAFTEREPPFDALVSRQRLRFFDLPRGAVIGTSSLRRKAQLLKVRPDLSFIDLRGNLDTRLRKMGEGQCDGMILALAGLKRLGFENEITEVLPTEVALPAVGQGSLALEIREDDARAAEIAACLDHYPSRVAVEAERTLMRELEGGCQIPVGAYGRLENGSFVFEAMVASLDGQILIREKGESLPEEARDLARKIAQKLLDSGGKEILEEIRRGNARPD